MTSIASRSASVRCVALIGGASILIACGGTEPMSQDGTGGISGGAGMPSGGSGGSAVTGGSGGTSPATGGASGVAGTSSGGASGASSGAGGTNAGTAGMTGGDGGMTGGSAGMAGAPPMGGAGSGGGGSGGTGSPGGSGGSQALSFRADIYPMFAMTRDPIFVYPGGSTFESCTTTGVCHGGVRPGAGLQMLDANMAYGQLLNVPSTTELCNGTTRVIAGNPAQSCLILFYEGRLRDELDWVDNAEIDLVRRWIAEGALP
jgi:hypothetical protein